MSGSSIVIATVLPLTLSDLRCAMLSSRLSRFRRPYLFELFQPTSVTGGALSASASRRGGNRLPPRDPSKNKRAQHRDRVRRGSVEMPGDLAGGVEAGNGRAVAQHARAIVGCEPAEGVSDRADQRPGQEWRLADGARPVRLR